MTLKFKKDDNEWREILTPQEFFVARMKGTERPFSGKYWNFNEDGEYECVCCGATLFASDSKFISSCGWPSFNSPMSNEIVVESPDQSQEMTRVEIT